MRRLGLDLLDLVSWFVSRCRCTISGDCRLSSIVHGCFEAGSTYVHIGLACFRVLRLTNSQAGSIITARLFMVIIATLTSNQDYHIVWSCAKIASTLMDRSLLLQDYPSCASYANGSNLEQLVPVSIDFGGTEANIGAALDVSFGAALWLAFNIHVLGVEIYVWSPLFSQVCIADKVVATSDAEGGRAA
jgi:hypothetical protein